MKDGEPWFVAKDVAQVLGFTNTNDATKHLDDEEKQVFQIKAPISRGNPNAVIINESGLYSLILRSRKPQAKAFKKWVTGTVLPAIRKDGMYVMGEEKVAKGELEETEFVLKAIQMLSAKVERFAHLHLRSLMN